MMASTSSIAAPIARLSTHRRAASAKPRGVVRARDTAAGASAPAIDASSDQVRSWMFRAGFRAYARRGFRDGGARAWMCARALVADGDDARGCARRGGGDCGLVRAARVWITSTGRRSRALGVVFRGVY